MCLYSTAKLTPGHNDTSKVAAGPKREASFIEYSAYARVFSPDAIFIHQFLIKQLFQRL
jgi:hypothetical protein